MVDATAVERPKRRGGPRAPAGKKPLMVIMDAKLIKKAKHAAVEDECKVSHIVELALTEWLAKPRKSPQ